MGADAELEHDRRRKRRRRMRELVTLDTSFDLEIANGDGAGVRRDRRALRLNLSGGWLGVRRRRSLRKREAAEECKEQCDAQNVGHAVHIQRDPHPVPCASNPPTSSKYFRAMPAD